LKKAQPVAKTQDAAGLPPAVDKRRHDRIPFPAHVHIVSHGVFGDQSADGVCTDISLEGVAFETDAKLFLQNIVDLVFEMENRVISRRSAKLLYRVGQKYGAYFVGPE
jgi:PilZ domain